MLCFETTVCFSVLVYFSAIFQFCMQMLGGSWLYFVACFLECLIFLQKRGLSKLNIQIKIKSLHERVC